MGMNARGTRKGWEGREVGRRKGGGRDGER